MAYKMNKDELRKKYNVTGLDEEFGQDDSEYEELGQEEPVHQETEHIEQGDKGPGTFTGKKNGHTVDSTHETYIPIQRLPDLWQIDAVCILMTIFGVAAIVMNLDNVLYCIFIVIYQILEKVILVLMFASAGIAGLFVIRSKFRGI